MAQAALGKKLLRKGIVYSRRTETSYMLLLDDEKLGKGSSCHVYKAVNKRTGKKVAVKLFKTEVAWMVRYEADLMNACVHRNVVRLLDAEVEADADPNFLVMDIMKESLDRVKKRFSYAEVKRIMKQLLTVVVFFHGKNICHFDVKPSNILFDSKMDLKLADWGIACDLSLTDELPDVVYTANYRPPELLLGAKSYDPFKAEMWAVGAVFAFLLLRNEDLFAYLWPESTPGMLGNIFKVFGKPNESSWPGISSLQHYNILEAIDPPRVFGLRKTFKDRHTTPERGALDLLERMMKLDPSQRISAQEALQSNYFN